MTKELEKIFPDMTLKPGVRVKLTPDNISLLKKTLNESVSEGGDPLVGNLLAQERKKLGWINEGKYDIFTPAQQLVESHAGTFF